MRYLDILERDIVGFLRYKNDFVLRGFDIGGGTPTVLTDSAFFRLLDIYDEATKDLKKSADFEPSVEATFETCTGNKVQRVLKSGIHRISLGLQTTDKSVLGSCQRISSDLKRMSEVVNMLKEFGIEKINIDLMFGLPGQTLESIKRDLQNICTLQPEQVTVYELRINQLDAVSLQSSEELYAAYCYLYDSLIKMGYRASFGQNTFSKDAIDFGVSSYLRSRMMEATPYKGFGISAQSMCSKGISYNIGKNKSDILCYFTGSTFENGDVYILPNKELANKYIAIAGYCNHYSKSVLRRLMTDGEYSLLKERLSFLKGEKLIVEAEDFFSISRTGFQHYGAINSMIRTPI